MIGYLIEANSVLRGSVAPLLLLLFAVVIVLEALQVGIHFSLKPLAFKWSRMSFAEGIKRIIGVSPNSNDVFPVERLYEVGKLIVFLLGFLGLSIGLLLWFLPELINGMWSDVNSVILVSYAVSLRLLASILLFSLLVGSIDLLYSRLRRARRLNMDVQEFRRDIRDNDGDPQQKGKRAELHREVLQQSVVNAVRRARLVVIGKGDKS